MPFQFTCEVCGAQFERHHQNSRRGLPHRYCSRTCTGISKRQPIEERFWGRLDKSGGPDACWLWTGRRIPSGYGHIKFEGKQVFTHRLSFYLTHGKWPERALHRCDNPPCCNPAHLFEGSDRDNCQDAIRKKRRLPCAGESCPSSRLVEDDVRQIRLAHAEGKTTASIARRFGVSSGTIYFIVQRKTWRHVT